MTDEKITATVSKRLLCFSFYFYCLSERKSYPPRTPPSLPPSLTPSLPPSLLPSLPAMLRRRSSHPKRHGQLPRHRNRVCLRDRINWGGGTAAAGGGGGGNSSSCLLSLLLAFVSSSVHGCVGWVDGTEGELEETEKDAHDVGNGD